MRCHSILSWLPAISKFRKGAHFDIPTGNSYIFEVSSLYSFLFLKVCENEVGIRNFLISWYKELPESQFLSFVEMGQVLVKGCASLGMPISKDGAWLGLNPPKNLPSFPLTPKFFKTSVHSFRQFEG